jgi:hypothetical protein
MSAIHGRQKGKSRGFRPGFSVRNGACDPSWI